MGQKEAEGRVKIENPKKYLSKKAIAGRLAGVFLAIAMVGASIKHHVDFETPNTPAGIWQDVKGIPTEWQYTILKWQQDRTVADRLNQPVPPTFDNRADEQLIQAGINAVPVSKEELPALLKDAIKPVEKNKFPEVAILFPLKLKDGEKVGIQTHWVKDAFNPINPGSNEPVAYGKIIAIGQKNTEIIMPLEAGKVSLGTTVVQNKNYVSSYVIIFFGPDGTEYNLVLRTPEDVRQLEPTSLVKNALADGKKNLDIPIGTPIATTSVNNVNVTADMFAYPPGYQKNKRGMPVDYDYIEKQENGKTTVTFLPR